MFPNACAEPADPPFSHDVLAEVTLSRMASGNWVQAFELLVRGLSAGNPDACAYQHAFAIFVQLGMTRQRQLAGSDEASDAEDWVCCLKEVFVLQAWIVR